jgi:hypothetical protein
MTTEDPLVDEPIPTFEEWLDEGAKEILKHPGFAIAKAAIEFVKYLWTREQLLISLLLQKDIINEHEAKEHFGDAAHKNMEKEGVKQLTRYLMRAATKGELTGPNGRTLDPDTVLVILNDILDLNNTGWSGRTLEMSADLFGGHDLRADYDKEVELLKALNEQKATARKTRELDAERERTAREDRARKVRIYCSKCRVAEKPEPSIAQQQQMIEGSVPIPKRPE